MALHGVGIWELNASATANNVNGGGFDPSTNTAQFLQDLTTDSNTANTASPVVSSVTYAFVAGDANNWLYIASGTNWTPGWYKIASVAGGKATLSAAIGAAVQVNTTLGVPSPAYIPNTVAGCATVGTPTAGVGTIDYSQVTAGVINGLTDLTSTAIAPTVVHSLSNPFTPAMVGNYLHLTTTGTGGFGVVGWYRITLYTSSSQVTVDRTTNTGTALAAGTFYVGGAMSMNSTLDDALFETLLAGNRMFVKSGTFTIGQDMGITTGGGTAQKPAIVEGYGTLRGDIMAGASTSYPTLAFGAFAYSQSPNSTDHYGILFTGTAASVILTGNNTKFVKCKITNSSTTAARNCINCSTDVYAYQCEFISYRGRGIATPSVNTIIDACYIHDSDTGFILSGASGSFTLSNTIIENCVTRAIDSTASSVPRCFIINNTLYGAENKLGVGIQLATGVADWVIRNNIFYGFTTAINSVDVQTIHFLGYNDFYNNTTDVTNVQKSINDIAINPAFTSTPQVTGTTGKFVAGNNQLVDTSKNFTSLGVVANQDFVYIVSGTGVTAGIYAITAISTTTNPNDTLTITPAPGTNTTADKVYQITTVHNFLPTGAI